MESLKPMYEIIKPYKCPKCNEDMLFFETKHNTIIDYKSILSLAKTASECKQYLEKRDIKHFKCIYCGGIFLIDWTKNWPYPLTDINVIKQFGIIQ